MISYKPKKKANSNTNKKKVDTTRDVIANTATTAAPDTEKKDATTAKPDDVDKKPEKPKENVTAPKPVNPPVEKPKKEPR